MPAKSRPIPFFSPFIQTAIALVIVIGVAVVIGYLMGIRARTEKKVQTLAPAPSIATGICSQDAKLCPDGTTVGRIAPSCEFAECPTLTQTVASTPLSEVETRCVRDTDCELINRELGLGCCYAGSCDAADYREEKWIAVNSEWLNSSRDRSCPTSCGPAPMCDVMAINTNYKASCVRGLCQKMPL